MVWESEFSIDNCSFYGNTKDYLSSAGTNFTLEDCDYSFLKGNVNWSFEEEILNHSGDETFMIEDMKIGDVNNDTYNDIVVLNMSLKTGGIYFHNLSIYLYNSTTEDFDLPIIKYLYNATYKEKSLEVKNIDDDYECEILVAYDNITVLNWDGSDWVEPVYSPLGSSDTHLDIKIGDMNNDSYQDVVTITDVAPNEVAVFLWNETDNSYDSPDYYTTGAIPSKLFIDDVNDDGRDDIITKYDSSFDHISIFNQSDSGFDTRYDMEFSGDIIANSLIVDDIDGDDKNDIVLEVERETPYYGNYLAYRLWNSTSSGFDDDEFFNTSLGYYSDLKYFDINNDGEKEIVGTSTTYGETEIYNITDLTLLMINSISNTQTHPSFIEYGNLNHDSFTDMVCYETGGQGSVLYWNGSTSNTTRSLVVDVRNDTDIGVQGATVKIYDADGQEIFNLTTNATGITPVAQVRLMEKDISKADYFGPFKVNITKLSMGTWYNVTRFFNITTDNGIYTLTKYIGNDTDNDGLTDGEEMYVIGTNSTDSDTDGDSILDGTEYGINDTTKPSTTGGGFVADEDTDTTTSALFDDTDHDGLFDGVEDINFNGKTDAGETFARIWDSDSDWISDGDEVNVYLTGPLDIDSDDDGSDDGKEIMAEYDPLDSGSVAPIIDDDEDGLTNAVETLWGTDPDKADTDGDGLYDGWLDTDDDGLYDLDDVGEMPYGGWWQGDEEVPWWESSRSPAVGTRGTDSTRSDGDGDGLDDNIEDINGMIWAEIEEKSSLGDGFKEHDDSAKPAGTDNKNCLKIGTKTNNVFEIDITAIGTTDEIIILLRAKKATTTGTVHLQLSQPSGPPEVYEITVSWGEFSFYIIKDAFTNDQQFETLKCDWAENVYLDQICILTDLGTWNGKSLQITNPNDADTDGDQVNDNVEVFTDGNNPELYWFEAEHLKKQQYSSGISRYSSASNFQAIKFYQTSGNWKQYLKDSYRLPCVPGRYQAAIRAYSSIYATEALKLTLFPHGGPSVPYTFDMETGWRWYFTPEFTKPGNKDFDLQVYAKKGMVRSNTLLDAIVFIRVDKHDPSQIFNCLRQDTDFDGLSDVEETKITFLTIDNDYDSGTLIDIATENDGVNNYYYLEHENPDQPDDINDLIPLDIKTPEGYYIFKEKHDINSDPEHFYIKTTGGFRHFKKKGKLLGHDLNVGDNSHGRVTYWTKPFDEDTDDDGLFDKYEYDKWHGGILTEKSNPNNPDTDGDEFWDGSFTKPRWNGEKIVDIGEEDVYRNGKNYRYCWVDISGCGEKRVHQSQLGPNNADSDGDGVDDGLEYFYGFYPKTGSDCDDYDDSFSDPDNNNLQVNWLQRYLKDDFLYGDEWLLKNWKYNYGTYYEEPSGKIYGFAEYDHVKSLINMYQKTGKIRFYNRAINHLDTLISQTTYSSKWSAANAGGNSFNDGEMGVLGTDFGEENFVRLILYDSLLCQNLLDLMIASRSLHNSNALYNSYRPFVQNVFNFWETVTDSAGLKAWVDVDANSGSYKVFWKIHPQPQEFRHYDADGKNTPIKRTCQDIYHHPLMMGNMLMKMIEYSKIYPSHAFAFTSAGASGNANTQMNWIFNHRIKKMKGYIDSDPTSGARWRYRKEFATIEDISHGNYDVNFMINYNEFVDDYHGGDPKFDLPRIAQNFKDNVHEGWGSNGATKQHYLWYQLDGGDSGRQAPTNFYFWDWIRLDGTILNYAKDTYYWMNALPNYPIPGYGIRLLMYSNIIQEL